MSKTFTKNIPVNEILHLGEHLDVKFHLPEYFL